MRPSACYVAACRTRLPRRFVLLGLGLSLVVLACGCGEEPMRLRVLSYNIHHGQGTDGAFDLPRIAKVITVARPDLVALQEVDRKTRRASGVDQAAELGKLTKMHAVFGKAMDYAGGQYGEAVLSRWPIQSHKAHPLGAPRGYEPRCALAVTVRPDKRLGALVFVGTHLDHIRKDDVRFAQARKLNELFAAPDAKGPVLLVGDLNAVPASRTIRALRKRWTPAEPDKPAPTWPADKPNVKIDYVLYRPEGAWRVVEVKVIDERIASDHRPLLVVLEYQAPAKP